ncbi:hypothetical protein [Bacillus sp. B4EP4a]|uniref:hypothetical protein n=1 Tax=Bacillus sp. B4EP4a TaxID=2590665 RepID=UPI001150BDF7|nr:hypothetical protein [Bacillus sp. B4EP4a]
MEWRTFARERRNNDLATEDISKLRGSMRSDFLDFDDALALFLKDGEIRNIREHTIKYYRNELSPFRRITRFY